MVENLCILRLSIHGNPRCALFHCSEVLAHYPSPFIRRNVPSIPSYLWAKLSSPFPRSTHKIPPSMQYHSSHLIPSLPSPFTHRTSSRARQVQQPWHPEPKERTRPREARRYGKIHRRRYPSAFTVHATTAESHNELQDTYLTSSLISTADPTALPDLSEIPFNSDSLDPKRMFKRSVQEEREVAEPGAQVFGLGYMGRLEVHRTERGEYRLK